MQEMAVLVAAHKANTNGGGDLSAIAFYASKLWADPRFDEPVARVVIRDLKERSFLEERDGVLAPTELGVSAYMHAVVRLEQFLTQAP